MGAFIKIVTNVVIAFVAGFGAALAAGAELGVALSAGVGAVVAIFTGLMQEKPGT